MLIRCLWTTTLPWIVLSQTYYMNFVFNNNGYMSRERHEVVSDGTQNSKWVDIDEEPLEINSMEHPHMERISYDDWASKETPSKDWPSKDLASNDWASRESQESYQSASNTDEVTQIVVDKHNHTKQKVTKITTTPKKVQTTPTPDYVYIQEFPPEIVPIEKVPKEHNPERHTTDRHTTERHTTERQNIKHYISKEYIQKEHIPKEQIPKEHIPKEHIPKEHIPKEHIPKEHIPKEHIPKKHTTKKHTTKRPTTKGIPKNNREKQFETTPTEKVQELTTETIPENMLIDIIEDSGEGQRQKETATPAKPKETTTEGAIEKTPEGAIETTLGDGATDTTDTSKENPKLTDTTDDDTSKENSKETDTSDDTSKENKQGTGISDDTSKENKQGTDTSDDASKETKKVTDTTDDDTSKETTKWKTVTPHPPEFFKYPGAKCHEEMDLHELFGISLERDRGIPSKVFCEFSNSWGGPWHLMTRIELPSRVHMRHWFFGYLTDDYKDMNINFLALAHIMNSMRIAMLIIGQDNNDQLVYNLYDDVVISGFNDLFMLRKAELVEANTTDLLFVSVGDVITTFSGRNRSCPFHVIGGWWGFNQWRPTSQYFCVFPVDRDVKRPGYMAIFIKPNPFAINNTAMYENVITTRRPWVPTVDARLMEQANNNPKVYRQLKDNDFAQNKAAALAELERRSNIYKDFEKDRFRDKGKR